MVQKAIDARKRFAEAALVLFRDRGYAVTTVPQIAERAGLTERTFYRYFVDKQEVMFWRASDFQTAMTEMINRASATTRPFDAVIRALEATGHFFDDNRSDAQARYCIVAAHPDFQEREMMKTKLLGSAMAEALQARGVQPVAARMASEAGIVIWKVTIEQWNRDKHQHGFSYHVRAVLSEFSAVLLGAEDAVARHPTVPAPSPASPVARQPGGRRKGR